MSERAPDGSPAFARPRRQLERLAWKYERLAALRARREEVERAGDRSFGDAEAAERKRAFRRIAREFPGALRELDSLPSSVLRERGAIVSSLIARDVVIAEGWVALVLDFHELVRAMLWVKRWIALRVGSGRGMTSEAASMLRERIERLRRMRGVVGVGGSLADACLAEISASLGGEGDEACDLERALSCHIRPAGGSFLDVVWTRLEERHGSTRAVLEASLFGSAPLRRA